MLEVEGSFVDRKLVFTTLQRGQKASRFSVDLPGKFSSQGELYCLLIGQELAPKVSRDPTEYALVLQSLNSSSQSQQYYERIGLLKVAASKVFRCFAWKVPNHIVHAV
jgi:hypothetical protein